MRLTKKQKNELEVTKYFIPKDQLKLGIPETEEDIIKYFEWSDKGKHKEDFLRKLIFDGIRHKKDYFDLLVLGKKWRDIHVGMYEEGIIDGSVPYIDMLVGKDGKAIPEPVMEYLAKNMFQGIDYEIIKGVYSEIKDGIHYLLK